MTKHNTKHPNLFYFMNLSRWKTSGDYDYLTYILGRPTAFICAEVEENIDDIWYEPKINKDLMVYFIDNGRVYSAKNGDFFLYELRYIGNEEANDKALRTQFTKKEQVFGRFTTGIVLKVLKLKLKLKKLKSRLKK